MSTKVQLANKNPSTEKADVLVAIVDTALQENTLLKALESALGGGLLDHLTRVEFEPAKGTVLAVPALGKGPAAQLIVVGVNEDDGGDGAQFGKSARWVTAVATGVREALNYRPQKITVAISDGADLKSVAQGASLGAYRFDRYFTAEKSISPLQQVMVLAPSTPTAQDKAEFLVGLRVAEGVCMARDLVNEPPNVLTPAEFAKRARQVAKKNQLVCKILDHRGIQNAGMNLHYAVGKGSENLPTFIHLTYKPKKSTGKVAFVGKGITFDSGGLCIKPGVSMMGMKTDMSGAGAVLGMMEAISALKPNVEVHGIIAAAENMPDAKAYRPNDVISSLSGKGVEIVNTDAEGRLVLADALTYAARLNPDFIVDAATLTGATLLSLGAPYSAFYTGSDEMAEAMKEASAEAGESFWHMPLVEELAAQLRSDITDLKHTGERMGGAITAALFLREFTEGVTWMHCDIPGPVFRDRASGMHPKGATGHAVLTFLNLIIKHGQKPLATASKSAKPKATASKPRAKKAPKKKASSRSKN